MRRRKTTGETALQKAILDALRLRFPRELYVARINAGEVMVGVGKARRPFRAAPAGWADIIGVVATRSGIGQFFAIEVKLPGEEQNAEQLEFEAKVNALNGYYAVVRSVNEAISAVAEAAG